MIFGFYFTLIPYLCPVIVEYIENNHFDSGKEIFLYQHWKSIRYGAQGFIYMLHRG